MDCVAVEIQKHEKNMNESNIQPFSLNDWGHWAVGGFLEVSSVYGKCLLLYLLFYIAVLYGVENKYLFELQITVHKLGSSCPQARNRLLPAWSWSTVLMIILVEAEIYLDWTIMRIVYATCF